MGNKEIRRYGDCLSLHGWGKWCLRKASLDTSLINKSTNIVCEAPAVPTVSVTDFTVIIVVVFSITASTVALALSLCTFKGSLNGLQRPPQVQFKPNTDYVLGVLHQWGRVLADLYEAGTLKPVFLSHLLLWRLLHIESFCRFSDSYFR